MAKNSPTDSVLPGKGNPTANHPFDLECPAHNIEHRLIEPCHPQTNGMIKGFNGRIEEIIERTRFSSADDLRKTSISCCRIYHNKITRKNLGYVPLVTALKNRQKTNPDIFKKLVHNLTGHGIPEASYVWRPLAGSTPEPSGFHRHKVHLLQEFQNPNPVGVGQGLCHSNKCLHKRVKLCLSMLFPFFPKFTYLAFLRFLFIVLLICYSGKYL